MFLQYFLALFLPGILLEALLYLKVELMEL